MDAADVIEMIVGRIGQSTQCAYAKKLGVSDTYLSEILRGNREPGPKILTALGLRKIVTYSPLRSARGK